MQYNTANVRISRIEADNNTYMITTRDATTSLVDSIAAIGLINPPILLPVARERYTIISGFRRITACRQLGWDRIDARILDDDTSSRQCALVAIAENCAQRELNLIETSRAIHLLSVETPDDESVAALAGQAGLALVPAVVRKVRPLCRLPQRLQRGIVSGTIALAMAERLQCLSEADAHAAFDLFQEIRAGLNVQREILDHAGDIARREDLKVKDVLCGDALMDIRADPDLEPARKAGLIRVALKRGRYPALSAAEETFAQQSGKLDLRKDMQLVPPAGFEGPDYNLTLRFRSVEQLEQQTAVLDKLVKGAAIKKILE